MRIEAQIGSTGAQHAVPGWQRRIDADTEKAQARLGGDRPLPAVRRGKIRRPIQTLVRVLAPGSRLARQTSRPMLIVNGEEELQTPIADHAKVSASLSRRPHGPNPRDLSDDSKLVEERAQLSSCSEPFFLANRSNIA